MGKWYSAKICLAGIVLFIFHDEKGEPAPLIPYR